MYNELIRFDNDGAVRWTRRFSDVLTFGAGQYASWSANAVLVYTVGGEKRIAWTVHHQTWWPSVLTVWDPPGRLLSRFVNSGWLTALNVTTDGRHLLAAGWSNDTDGSMLAALDIANPSGTSPERAASAFECLTCPPGRPVRYFVMPRPEVARLTGRRLRTPRLDVLNSGTIEIRGTQSPDEVSAEVIYEFSPALEPVRASASDTYWEWHRALEAEHIVAHAADTCPERRGFTVRRWDPKQGWCELHVPSATGRRAAAEGVAVRANSRRRY